MNIRLNHSTVANSSNNCLVNEAINRLTNDHQYEKTHGRLVGLMSDRDNPDKGPQANGGAKGRLALFCTKEPNDAPANWKAPIKYVSLTGPLLSSISNLNFPISSEIDIYIEIQRHSSEMVITRTMDGDDKKYRLIIKKVELQIPKCAIAGSEQTQLENIWKTPTTPISYIFNRYEVVTATVESNQLSFTTPVLFPAMEIPPLSIGIK